MEFYFSRGLVFHLFVKRRTTMNDTIAAAVSGTSKKVKILGYVIVVLGLLSIAAPFVAGAAVAMMVGALLFIAGIAQTLYAFQSDSFGKTLLRVLFGGITVLSGFFMLVAPAVGLATLTMILIVYFLVDGIFAVITGLQLKPLTGWGWMVFSGVASVLLAWMIWQQWPVSGAWAVGTLVGVRLLFTGMSMITLGAIGKELSSKG